eukprot:3941554-Rhodomonas_salina.4
MLLPENEPRERGSDAQGHVIDPPMLLRVRCAMSATDLASAAMPSLRAVRGIELGYAPTHSVVLAQAMLLRTRYALPGTDSRYATTRPWVSRTWYTSTSWYCPRYLPTRISSDYLPTRVLCRGQYWASLYCPPLSPYARNAPRDPPPPETIMRALEQVPP